jgi:hypothetical protein
VTLTAPNPTSYGQGEGGAAPKRKRSNPILERTRDAELITMMHDWFQTCRQGRLSYEREWYENLAFYFGKQYVQWANKVADAGLMRLIEPPMPPWRVRLISNKIKPVIRKELAKVTKEKPQPFVIPASTDDDDLAAARAGEQIFEHVTRELKFDRTVRRTQFWTLLCGTAFMKDWYDPNLADANGVMGSIQIEPITPFQFFIPDPQEEELDNQPYGIHVLAKTPEFVEGTYKKTVEADSNTGSGLLEQRFLHSIGVEQLPRKFVAVKECWIKPCKKFPDGAVITYAGDVILNVAEEWPFQYRDYPFTKMEHVPTGQFYAQSVIPDLIPLQKEMNRTRSQIIEAKNRMSKPQLIAPRGSVDPSKVTSEPGLIIFYTPGFAPPQPLPLVAVPGYVIDEINRCQRDMDDISGQHEISKGNAPTGVSAATAISFLQEQDDAMISPSITSLEECVARIGTHLLSHVDQFWEAERTIKAIGENNAFDVVMFNKAAINGNTDLNIQAGSATPRSTAAKQAFIMEMMDKKYITAEQGLRYLNMSETGRMYEELQVSTRQAERENLRLSQGEEIQTNTFDEDQIHVLAHDMYRRRQAFDRLPDEVKIAFENHVQQHKQKMGLQQGTPIAPGEPLPPSPDGQLGAASPDGGGGPPGMPPMPPGGAPPQAGPPQQGME